jgi:hypothetical protein
MATALPGLRAAPQLALGVGEELKYSVSWAILPGAGEIDIVGKAAADPTGALLLQVVTTTSTRGLARLILPFDARAESLFDFQTGRLLRLGEESTTRMKSDAHTVDFDYANRVAVYARHGSPGPALRIPLPAGYPEDLITCLVQARTWNLKPGDARDALILFEKDFYPITVHAIRMEPVSTSLGVFNALCLEPRMEKTPPKGMFKRGSIVRVWIARDALHLPVRLQVNFKIGAGTATLVHYRPPDWLSKPKPAWLGP